MVLLQNRERTSRYITQPTTAKKEIQSEYMCWQTSSRARIGRWAVSTFSFCVFFCECCGWYVKLPWLFFFRIPGVEDWLCHTDQRPKDRCCGIHYCSLRWCLDYADISLFWSSVHNKPSCNVFPHCLRSRLLSPQDLFVVVTPLRRTMQSHLHRTKRFGHRIGTTDCRIATFVVIKSTYGNFARVIWNLKSTKRAMYTRAWCSGTRFANFQLTTQGLRMNVFFWSRRSVGPWVEAVVVVDMLGRDMLAGKTDRL